MRNHLGILALALGVVAVAPTSAQTPSASTESGSARADSRWTPYLGCWNLVHENVSDRDVPVSPGMVVCVQPSGASGVAITTTVEGKTILEQKIVADGLPQPVTQSDCEGTQRSDWSRDGERLFTRVELQCAARPKRVVSGVTLLAKGTWVDVQAADVDGNEDVRIRRYQRTSDRFTSASAVAETPMSLEDVIEANAKIGSTALEGMLDETGGRFNLNSRTLKQLADAGVSANVIDLMVAQSFPERFRVERPGTYRPLPTISSMGSNTTVIMGSARYPYPYYDPYYYSYYYSPFAYPGYWGSSYGYRNYYNNHFYGSPTTVIVPDRRGTGAGGTAQPSSGDGIVVNGRGYTRVRPSRGSDDESAPAQRTTTSRRGVRSSGSSGESSGSESSSGSSGSSSGSSSGGSVSGSGYSGRGSNSGSDSGRTAQPKR
jgi:uncharacterized membrane protein YgcG